MSSRVSVGFQVYTLIKQQRIWWLMLRDSRACQRSAEMLGVVEQSGTHRADFMRRPASDGHEAVYVSSNR